MNKFNRNSNSVDMDTKSNSNVVDNEVKKLIKQNPHNISTSAMYKLREKYNDQDLLDAIQDGFIERTREIRKKGRKFAKMVREKYSNSIPLHMLLKKAHKFKKKYNLSDAEFSEFRRVYEQTIEGVENTRPTEYNVTTPFTNMSRVLGQGLIDADDGLKFDEKDYDSIQQILRLHSECKSQHSQVILQSMEYQDMAMQAISGEYDRRRNNPHCHVHPVIAAMFLPKINIFEENMIYANIAYIVKQKYNKKPIMTSNDYELFYNIISDPTDVVCSSESAVKDLLKRSKLQCELWRSISTLRNGRYYDCTVNELTAAIDTCRRNYEENPDLIYDSDEGSYLTKIFGAFSLRPTVIAQTPLISSQIMGITIGAQANLPVVPKVYTAPFITVRLPPQTNLTSAQTFTSVDLQNYISSHPQFVMEDGQLVQKSQEVMFSNGVLVYYVPRRSNLINIGKLVNNPLEFNRLPRVVHGFDRLNETAINVPLTLDVGTHQQFDLKSAVVLDVSVDKNNLGIEDKLIIGNHCIIYKDNVPYEYNPRRSAIHFEDAIFERKIDFNSLSGGMSRVERFPELPLAGPERENFFERYRELSDSVLSTEGQDQVRLDAIVALLRMSGTINQALFEETITENDLPEGIVPLSNEARTDLRRQAEPLATTVSGTEGARNRERERPTTDQQPNLPMNDLLNEAPNGNPGPNPRNQSATGPGTGNRTGPTITGNLNIGLQNKNIYDSYNYQQPVSCLDGLGSEVQERLQTRGTIFIYKDSNPNSKIRSVYGL